MGGVVEDCTVRFPHKVHCRIFWLSASKQINSFYVAFISLKWLFIFTTLLANSADDKLMLFFLFFPVNRI